MDSIPGLRRSSGGGNGNPLQYSCLGKPMNRGTRWTIVHRVAKSWMWLSTQAQSSIETGSVQFNHSFVSDSLQYHGLRHARLPCPSPTPRACSNSCPFSQWCHPTISSSVVSSSCLQSFPASGSFLMSWLFTSGGQSTGASASASVLPMNIQSWLPLKFSGLISMQSKGLSRVFSNTTVQKHQFLSAQPSLWANSPIHMWLLEKS